MRVPKRFKLFGQTISVEYIEDGDLRLEHNDLGTAELTENWIALRSTWNGRPLPQDRLEHIFLHELVHFVLDAAEEDEFDPPLTDREALVDRIANLPHQAITTSEFDE
jgi:hypothetical protein